MSRLRKSRPLPLLILALICLALAGAVYRQARDLRSPPAPPVPTIAVMTKGESEPPEITLRMPPREAFSEVVARPIFSPTRRPAAVETEAAAPAASQPFDANLVGIVIWSSLRLALVRVNGAEGVLQVPEGGAVSGWTVVTIEPGRVVLRQGESETELLLPYKASKNSQ